MITVRSFRGTEHSLDDLRSALLGEAEGWAMVFTHTRSSLRTLSEVGSLDEAIWGHLFSDSVELRWRRDGAETLAIALGADTAGWPAGSVGDLTMHEGHDVQFPLLGHYDGSRWGQANLRPSALDYPTSEIDGREIPVHARLAVTATALIDADGTETYHWHRGLTVWGADA